MIDLTPWKQRYEEETAHLMPLLIGGAVCWSVLFAIVVFIPAFSRRSFDFQNRLVSLVHAIASLILCARLVLFAPGGWEVGARNTDEQSFVLLISMSYFLYDTVAVVFYEFTKTGPIDYATLMHHVATLAGLGFGLFADESGGELGVCIVMMETSNPFMHSVALLRELGLGDSTVALVNKAVFSLSFFVARIIFGPYLTYITLMSETNTMLVKISGLSLFLVSLVWFGSIITMLGRTVKKHFGSSSSSSKLKST